MSPRASLLALVAASFTLHACNSDDLLGGLDQPDTTTTGTTTTGGSTTALPTTGDITTTTTTTGVDTTGGSSTTLAPEPPPTCGELLDCVLPCALGFDLECAQMCAAGLEPGEATEAFDLAVCVGMACFESGACTTDTLMDPVCLACIGFLLMDESPAGCEAEAEACASAREG